MKASMPLLAAIALGAPASSFAQEGRFLLDDLVGQWCIEGQMGEVPLQQEAEGKLILDDQFLQVRVTEEGQRSSRPYEALYVLGYDSDGQRFTMTLFDVFGAQPIPVTAIGRRNGKSVSFQFPYEEGEFVTILQEISTGVWLMDQFSAASDGSLQRFAHRYWHKCSQ